jgi:hypothetical protein
MRPPGRTPPSRGRTPELPSVISRQHLDDLVDDYVRWREACARVSAASEKWKCAPRDGQRLAFSEYLVSLDCEQEAAMLYQRTVERLAAMTPADSATG